MDHHRPGVAGEVAEAASWLLDPSPRMQSPPKVLAPSAARDGTDMENRVIQQKDESLVIFSSHVVKPSFIEVLTHQEL